MLAMYWSHWEGITISVTISYTDWSFDRSVLCPVDFSFSLEKLSQEAGQDEVVVNPLLARLSEVLSNVLNDIFHLYRVLS